MTKKYAGSRRASNAVGDIRTRTCERCVEGGCSTTARARTNRTTRRNDGVPSCERRTSETVVYSSRADVRFATAKDSTPSSSILLVACVADVSALSSPPRATPTPPRRFASHTLACRWRNPPRASPFSRGVAVPSPRATRRARKAPAGDLSRTSRSRRRPPRRASPQSSASPRTTSLHPPYEPRTSLWFRANREPANLVVQRPRVGPDKVEDALVDGNLRRVRNLAEFGLRRRADGRGHLPDQTSGRTSKSAFAPVWKSSARSWSCFSSPSSGRSTLAQDRARVHLEDGVGDGDARDVDAALQRALHRGGAAELREEARVDVEGAELGMSKNFGRKLP